MQLCSLPMEIEACTIFHNIKNSLVLFVICIFHRFSHMAPNTRTSQLPRGKRVKYTQQGAVPIPPDPEENPAVSTELSASASASASASQSGVLKRKGRGPGQIIPPRLPSERPVIWPVGKQEFTTENNPTQITSVITKLALQLMPGPCISFLLFDQNTRNALEDGFLVQKTTIIILYTSVA